MQIKTGITEMLLLSWADWARANPDKLNYPSEVPFYRLMRGNPIGKIIMDDREAMVIDSIVSRLCFKHKEMGECLVVYYFCGCNAIRAARYLNTDRRRLKSMVETGIAWIDGRIDDIGVY